jgi:23S rRNA (cytosine1962-C5)-methyltransferase
MAYPKVLLKTKKDQSLRRFHPWIFSGAIKKMHPEPDEGDVVEVFSNNGEYLGTGHYQVGSIAIKIFSFSQEEPTAEFWKKKIQAAYDLRKMLGVAGNPNNNTYRLIHAEGDQMPGLIADFYNGTLVILTPSIGMHLMKAELVTAFREVMGDELKPIYDKSEKYIPKEAEIVVENGVLWGEDVSEAEVLEHGHKFRINWETGQKTGFFIDQRENRLLLAKYSKGKKILNTFCYSGGFSIYALAAGAAEVHSLDSSKKALDLVDENIELSGFGDLNHKCIQADATDHIKDMGEDYDIIVLDPPAFAKHQSAKHKAVQGYKRLNANAIRHLKPGGLLFTYSCSQAVDKYLFNHTITAAAISAGRSVKILHQMHQPADHPVNIYHPEGEYLKGLVVQVD